MKNRLLALALIVLTVGVPFAGCKKEGLKSASPLPDWEYSSFNNDWYHYPDVTPEMLGEYIASAWENGFTVIGPDPEVRFTTLIRDGEWIEIIDNIAAGAGVEIKLVREASNKRRGVSKSRAEELIRLCLEKDEQIASIMDRTPEGLFKDMGLSYFECTITENGGSDHFRPGFFVGENGAISAERLDMLNGILVCDADGDGACEVITISYGPSSGVHTEQVTVIGVSEGVPYIKAADIFTMEHGKAALVKTEEGISFSLSKNVFDIKTQTNTYAEPVLYPIRVKEGSVAIDLPEGDKEGPRAWGGAAFGYSHYDQRDELSEGITLIARREGGSMRFAPLLTAEAELPLFGYNALKFISAEETARLLERYGLPAEKLSVRMADFPMRADSALREATAEEYERIAALVGIG